MKIASTRNTLAIALVFTALSGISSLGHAKMLNPDIKQATVSYADLNIETEAGQKMLEDRVRSAATTVCSSKLSTRELRDDTRMRECREVAVERAMRSVNRYVAAIKH